MRPWWRCNRRFDLNYEPNEINKFGWVVEIDSYIPSWTPRKRTALGRFKHEAVATTRPAAGNAVVFSGDDARFEYVYKFVSEGTYNENHRTGNRDLLDSGTLYVAKFNDDGSAQRHQRIHQSGSGSAGSDPDGPSGGHRQQPGHQQSLCRADQQHATRGRRRERPEPSRPESDGPYCRDHRGQQRQRRDILDLADLQRRRGG